ncbi:MAG: hypothetical protein R2874_03745 [Desulfobacterales bacterium]
MDNKTEKMRAFHDALYDQYARALNGPSHLTDRMKGLMMSFLSGF